MVSEPLEESLGRANGIAVTLGTIDSGLMGVKLCRSWCPAELPSGAIVDGGYDGRADGAQELMLEACFLEACCNSDCRSTPSFAHALFLLFTRREFRGAAGFSRPSFSKPMVSSLSMLHFKPN